MVAIGILPTLTDADLTLANLSNRTRYRALNEQVLRQRHGRANLLDITGSQGETMHSAHHDVMLEAAATSFQVHLQVPASETVRSYNAALIASAPVVALSGNSPLLFGRQLWQETRIPLFEQALNIGAREDGAHDALARVSFGSGYAGYSLVECFRENLERFEPLLPVELADPADRLAHLRLHNGTIWRWNRPLVGFDADGSIRLRVEHRPMAAGPSMTDMTANLAFSIGLIAALAAEPAPPERGLAFDDARRNFYDAARLGGVAKVDRWPRPAGRPPAGRTGATRTRRAGGTRRGCGDCRQVDGAGRGPPGRTHDRRPLANGPARRTWRQPCGADTGLHQAPGRRRTGAPLALTRVDVQGYPPFALTVNGSCPTNAIGQAALHSASRPPDRGEPQVGSR